MAVNVATGFAAGVVMRTIYLVARYEFELIARGKAFWVFTFALPIVLLAVNLFMQNQIARTVSSELSAFMSDRDVRVIHYVDTADLIASLPPDFAAERLQLWPDEAVALAAMNAGEIDQFFLIDPDYLQNGRITIFTFQPLPVMEVADARQLEDLLTYNFLQDANTAALFNNPIAAENLTIHQLAVTGNRVEDSSFLVGVFFLFFLFIFSGGQYMLRSVSRESQNRTKELLLVSINSRHFMWGKLIGLSAIALVQILLWGLLFSFISSPVSQQSSSLIESSLPTEMLPEGLLAVGSEFTAVTENPSTLAQFEPNFIVWSAIFLFLGFFMMSALFLVLGVASPKTQFAVQISGIIMFIMAIVFAFNLGVIAKPDSVMAFILSMIPLSAPISMTTRIAVSSPPLWQILLSMLGLIITINFLVWLATRMARADRLLTGISWSSLRARVP